MNPNRFLPWLILLALTPMILLADTVVVEDHFTNGGVDTTLDGWTPDTTGTAWVELVNQASSAERQWWVFAATDTIGAVSGEANDMLVNRTGDTAEDLTVEATLVTVESAQYDPV